VKVKGTLETSFVDNRPIHDARKEKYEASYRDTAPVERLMTPVGSNVHQPANRCGMCSCVWSILDTFRGRQFESALQGQDVDRQTSCLFVNSKRKPILEKALQHYESSSILGLNLSPGEGLGRSRRTGFGTYAPPSGIGPLRATDDLKRLQKVSVAD